MRKQHDLSLVGTRFGKLITIEPAGWTGAFRLWKFKCDCGGEKIIRECSVKHGLTRSCGCVHAEVCAERIPDITGQKFVRLTARHSAGRDSNRFSMWSFICECGKEIIARSSSVIRGQIQSCGCLALEIAKRHGSEMGKNNATHHMSRTPTWVSWTAMMQRCYNPKTIAWPHYGAVGIVPCEFIRATPVNLVALIGLRLEGTSLDRIQNRFGYSCGQCKECIEKQWHMNIRWATKTVQSRNRKIARVVTINGVTKHISEWAETLNVPVDSLRYQQLKQLREAQEAMEYSI